MRKLAALVCLFSVQAYACPNLTGNYTCVYQDGSSETVEISQEQKDGVTVYKYNGSDIPADNQVYPVPEDQTLKEGTFRAWCDDPTTLKGELIGKYYSNGSYYGDLNMLMNFSMVDANLKQVTTGTLKNSGGEYPLDAESTCTRNN